MTSKSLESHAKRLWYLTNIDDGKYKTARKMPKGDYTPYKYQLKQPSMLSEKITNCPYPVGHYIVNDHGSLRKVDIPCKSWRCPACSRVKRNIVLDRARDGFAIIDRPVYFMTLTAPPDTPHELIMKWWNRLRASLRRRGYQLEYFFKKEFTAKGARHLHIAYTGGEIKEDLLKHLWYLATDKRAYIVNISPVKSLRNVAGYLMPYMAKDDDNRDYYRKGERRYGFSRHPGFRSKKKTYASMMGILNTDIRIRLGHHINTSSKYWPGITEKYIEAAGIHAQRYFEARTIEPHGLKKTLNGNRYYARELMNLISPEVRPFYGNVDPDGPIPRSDILSGLNEQDVHGRRKSRRRPRYWPKHNKHNLK
jgi:hypothetical protein